MTGGQIVVAVLVGLVVNECVEVCPWVARKLVAWSARRRYTDPARAGVRAEELVAVIDDRPGNLLKLLSAFGFAAAAVTTAAARRVAQEPGHLAARALLGIAQFGAVVVGSVLSTVGLADVLVGIPPYGLVGGLVVGLVGGLVGGLAYGVVVGLVGGLVGGLGAWLVGAWLGAWLRARLGRLRVGRQDTP